MSQLAGTSRSDEPIQTSPIDHRWPGKLGPRGMAPCREFNNVAGRPHCSETLREGRETEPDDPVADEALHSSTFAVCVMDYPSRMFCLTACSVAACCV